MEDDRLFQRKQRLHLLEARECALRDAGDRVGRLQALPQHQLVEEDFGKTKIPRNIIGIQIVQGVHGWRAARVLVQRRGIGEVNDVHVEPRGNSWKLCVVPQVAARRVVADQRGMEMQTRIGAWRGVANEVLLPGSCDEMNGGDLFLGEQASREANRVPLDARELAGRRCKRDGNSHASTSDRIRNCARRAPSIAMNHTGSERSKASVSAKQRTMTNSSMPRKKVRNELSATRRSWRQMLP